MGSIFLKEDRFMIWQLIGITLKSFLFIYWAYGMTYTLTSFDVQQTLQSLPLHSSIYLAVFSFAFLSKRKMETGLILNFLVSLLLLADFVYFRAFGVPTSLFSLSMIDQLGDVGDSVMNLLEKRDLFFLADVLFWAIMIRFTQGSVRKSPVQQKKFAIWLLLAAVSGYLAYPQGLMQKVYKTKHRPIFAIQKITPLGYHLYDSYRYLQSKGTIAYSQEEILEVQRWFEENRRINEQRGSEDEEYRGIFKGKNVIFIHFESLENSLLNQQINGQEITPNLNRLLLHSLYFPKIKEQVGEGNSADAEFMVFNSLYPLSQGIISLLYPSNDYFSLPREMAENGYDTAAFLGMEKGFMNMAIVLPNYGFRKIYSLPDFQSGEKIGLGISDDDMLKQSVPFINHLERPFFAYMITLTNHVPYKLPASMQEPSLTVGIKNDRVKKYLQTAHYTDKAIGSFMELLKKEGLLDNTVLVIYGDHQGINKYYEKDVIDSQLPWLPNHKNLPLMIYHPSLKGRVMDRIGGQVDILPTVHGLLGLPEDSRSQYRVGRNLMTTKEGFALLRNQQYVSDHLNEPQIAEKRKKGIEMSSKVIQGNLFLNP